MKRIVITYILLFSLTFYFGCSSLQPVNKESWNQIFNQENRTDEIIIWTNDGYRYPLIWESIIIQNDSIYGNYFKFGDKGMQYRISIPLDKITKIEKDQFDLEATIILIGFFSLFFLFFLLMAAEGMKSAVSGIRF